MIGIFDSGLGGITTHQVLKEHYPNTSFLVLADQKNAPYGDKGAEEIMKIAKSNIEWFQKKGVKKVIVACNTICSTVLPVIQNHFPDMEMINIVDQTIEYLKKQSFSSILILGTTLTIQYKRYEHGIKEAFPDVKVYPVAASKLVPMIESGASNEELMSVLHEYLDEYQGKVDAVLLACTHYPLLSSLIHEILPVSQYDANQAIIEFNQFQQSKSPRHEIYTSGDPKHTQKQIETLFGEKVEVKSL